MASIRVTIETKTYPLCDHPQCESSSCLGLTPVEVSANCDLEAWSISDLDINPDIEMLPGDWLILRDELLEECERIHSLCPGCESGISSGALCRPCSDLDVEERSQYEALHGAGVQS